jgi:hypothetical protein
MVTAMDNTEAESRVLQSDARGQLQSIPASCTDAGGCDVFVEIAAGDPSFATRI